MEATAQLYDISGRRKHPQAKRRQSKRGSPESDPEGSSVNAANDDESSSLGQNFSAARYSVDLCSETG